MTTASYRETALGTQRIERFVFTTTSKSQLGYDLLAAINSGGLKMYDQNADPRTAADFWRQCRLAHYELHANKLPNFYVPERDGHGDLLIGLALCSHAAQALTAAPAGSQIAAPIHYCDGRFK